MDFKSMLFKKKILHSFFVVLFYTIIYCIFFSPSLLSNELLAPGDGFIQSVPYFYQNLNDLWNQFIFSGYPQFAEPQSMKWYLPRIILKYFSFNSFVILAYIFSSVFSYGYAFRLTKNIFASIIAGTIYGLGGFFLAHLGHTNMIHAICWLPLMIWGIDVLIHEFSTKWYLITVCSMVLNILAGHPQIMVYSFVLTGIYIVFKSLEKKKQVVNSLFISFSAIIVSILLASIQLLPTLELSKQSVRAEMNFETFVGFSLPVKQGLMMLFPFLFGGIPGTVYKFNYFGQWGITEMIGYIGWIPLMLVTLVLFKRNILLRNQKNFWIIIFIGSALLVLGDATPIAKLMYSIPGINLFRAPTRHFMEFSLATSVLSAISINSLLTDSITLKVKRTFLYVSSISILILAVTIYAISPKLIKLAQLHGINDYSIKPWENLAIGIPFLMAVLSIIAVWLFCHNNINKQFFSKFLLYLVLVIDLSSFGWFFGWQNGQKVSVIDDLRSIPSQNDHRIVSYEGSDIDINSALVPNLSSLANTNNTSGYGPLVIDAYKNLTGIEPNGRFNLSVLDPLNRSLDLLAGKELYIHKENTISKDGVIWSQSPITRLSISNPAVSLNINNQKAEKIGLVAMLGSSAGLSDNTKIAQVKITYLSGKNETSDILVGRDVSEWAYDHPDVIKTIKHSKAEIFSNFAVDDGKYKFDGHSYIKYITPSFDEPINNIYIELVNPSEVLVDLDKVSLINPSNSYPVTVLSSALSNSRWSLVADLPNNISKYENSQVMPRAWLVGETMTLPGSAILNAVKTSKLPNGKDFDPSHTALVEKSILKFNTTKDDKSQVSVENIYGDEELFKVSTSKEEFLVTSDIYYPGWKAFIDGAEVEIYKTNYLLRGVVVPSGTHEVRFIFEPKSFLLGKSLFGIGLLFLFGLVSSRIFLHYKRKK